VILLSQSFQTKCGPNPEIGTVEGEHARKSFFGAGKCLVGS